MKRKIISIDEEKCTGCGQCIPDCPEGALQLIDGKARLVSDLFCDGLGACIGTCPEGAISVIEREAVPYDEKTVMATIAKQGAPVIKAHLEHLVGHGQTGTLQPGDRVPDRAYDRHSRPRQYCRHTQAGPGSCPKETRAGCRSTGTRRSPPVCVLPGNGSPEHSPRSPHAGTRQPVAGAVSELRQWPVQLTLLNADASYFDNADLLISADCVPFAYAGFHNELLRDKILVIFCPKLDADIDGYIEKLAAIFTLHAIKSITVARMEVPCCGGVRHVVDKALEKSGKKIPVDGEDDHDSG